MIKMNVNICFEYLQLQETQLEQENIDQRNGYQPYNEYNDNIIRVGFIAALFILCSLKRLIKFLKSDK